MAAEIEKEMVELESKQKRDKKQSSKEADERKADFLRQSAAIQRRIDDNAAEMQKHTQAIAQLEPEANEMRQQLRDLLRQLGEEARRTAPHCTTQHHPTPDRHLPRHRHYRRGHRP